ncbi:SDR family NAD(P)-dependent oxidoreductase, partial [Candidatus Poribacteria bacterium]|nr:SDR family NAD(P)-dependent oxidoreductase [Candidatus Poribacteria bacterium]
MSLTEKVAIVTGGTRGIGQAIVLELVSSSVKVAFTYQRNQETADALCKTLKEQGGEVISFRQDVTDFEGAKSVLEAVNAHFGRMDMLVNNAGIARDKLLVTMNEEDWRTVIETNLYGTINFSRAVIYSFMKQKSGRIVN